MTEYTDLKTPSHCVADFCLIPIGTSSPSVSSEIASILRLVRASGLSHEMHSAGTTVEGSWDDVMRLMGQAHTLMHERQNVARVQTDIRVGTRIDKQQRFRDKVTAVQEILGRDGEQGEEKTM